MSGNFVKNTSITFITKVLNFLLAIGVSVILARALGPEGKGIYALAILIPTLVYAFVNFGLGSSVIYYLGKKKYSASLVAGNSIILSLLLTVLIVFIFGIFILFFKNAFLTDIPYYIFLLSIPLSALLLLNNNLVNILLGTHRFTAYNIILSLTIVSQLLLLSALLLFSSVTVFSAYITYLFSIFLITITLLIYLKKIFHSFIFKLTRNYIKDFFSYGLKVFLGNVMAFLHLRVDIIILNSYLNPTAVGHYSVAVGVTEQLWMLPNSAATILFPRITSEKDETIKKNVTAILCRNILFLTLIASFILFLISKPLIIILFSDQFLKAVLPLQILLAGTFMSSGAKILGNDMSARGKPMINTYTNIITLVVNVVLNIIFIKNYGIAGVAFASAISYSLLFTLRLVFYKKISKNRIIDTIFIKKSDFLLYKESFRLILAKLQNLSLRK